MRKGKYFTIRYDKDKDEFQIWLCNGDPEKDDEWGYCIGCRCIADIEHHTEAEYIHYTILTKVRDLLKQGWKYY